MKRTIKKLINKLPQVKNLTEKLDSLNESLSYPPGHYYSPIPDFQDLKKRENEIWFNEKNKNIVGIKLNEKAQLELLDHFITYYHEQPFSEYKVSDLRYYFANDFFSFSDSIFYYCMLRHLKPKRVLEIGSGFSSCVLLDTNDLFFNSTIQCTFIDPEPQRLLDLLKADDNNKLNIIPQRVQDIDLGTIGELQSGDILFIDSSHVVKTGSDVNLIFSKILPALASGVFIHVHDAFWPFEYPEEYIHNKWAWNELYILRAFLFNNHEYKIRLFPSFLEKYYGAKLLKSLPLTWKHPPKWPTLRGASLWIERV